LDFFQQQASLTAKVPRVTCPQHGVHQVNVLWARPVSGFALLFEALGFAHGQRDGGGWYGHDHELFAGFFVTKVGVDECSKRKGISISQLSVTLRSPGGACR
jgi:hypothetical protein